MSPEHALPGYEDTWYYMWKERRLPVNVDPFENKLENAEDRARLARVFERGLDHVVGYALPLRREYYTDGSSDWVSRRVVLPAGADVFEFPAIRPWAFDCRSIRSPGCIRRTLITSSSRIRWPRADHCPSAPPWLRASTLRGRTSPRISARARNRGANRGNGSPRERPRKRIVAPDLPPATGQSAPWIVRTALCTEMRDGILRVFMPPQRYLEDYLALVTAIEDTAADLGMPVLVEGYAPPHDSRVHMIKVTPDPGVIEVNMHPAASWDELGEKHHGAVRRGAPQPPGHRKIHARRPPHRDGRRKSHFDWRALRPPILPILRNPGLLRSLIGYWHNHPALSYLFSGIFVGPTSQAPRIDEARNDQVYEMEIAFQQIPDHGTAAPWLVDRIFRNLLVDATGSTHRAEFCIDKLYSPDTASGRLGLLEMRAFEMPPHSRMSLTQHLLLRALVAHLWEKPYRQELVRWRTEVHDRFMLPYFVHQDLEDVVSDLNAAGYPLRMEWFDPHFEFRFPLYGTIEQRGIELELSPGYRTVARDWRRGQRGRHGAIRRLLAGTIAGFGKRNGGTAPRGHLQRPPRAAASDRDERPVCGRRAIPRMAAAQLPASDHRNSCAAGVRSGGHLVRPLDRRMHLSCRASRRQKLRQLSDQRIRRGEPAHRALFQIRPHARASRCGPGKNQQRITIHTGPEIEMRYR